MPVELIRGDITDQDVDAIVNAANSSLLGGGGVDGAIHRRGGPAVLAACQELRASRYPDGLPTGTAVATPAGNLTARWVIHTVAPVYSRSDDRSETLRSCYRESLRVAAELGVESIAFPLISSGIYGWPIEDALQQALSVLHGTAQPSVVRVVLWQEDTFRLAKRLIQEF